MSSTSRFTRRLRVRRPLVTGAAAALASLLSCPGFVASQEVDGTSLMRDLSVLSHDSMGGRFVGSEGGTAARAYIVERLGSLGVAVDSGTFEVERGGTALTGVNVVARIPGTGIPAAGPAPAGTPAAGLSGTPPDRAGLPFVLTAHYDHVGTRGGEIYNGADDNASGTAALLAFAEAIRDRPLARDVLLVFLDAEEGGLSGARAYVEQLSRAADPRDALALNVNLDMVSRSEAELWVAGTWQNPALRPIVEGVTPAAGVVLRFGHDGPEWTGSDNWSGASDHAAFDRAGIPFLYFGVEDHPDYHRPTDDVERVDPVWYRAAVETILGAVRALDAAPAALEQARATRAGG